jgi:transposase
MYQKNAQRRGATIVFLDETGFRLQPVNRRTWARRGQTPVQPVWDRHDRLSVIGALTVSAQRRRIGTPFQIHPRNLCADEVVNFIRQLRKQLQRPPIICWDRLQVHRPAKKKIAATRMRDIDFEWLPAYCPKLNPVEARWSNTKYADLANFVPDHTSHLKRTVRSALQEHQSNHHLKHSSFKRRY